MDFIVSYHLYNKLKKKELNELFIQKNTNSPIKDTKSETKTKTVSFKVCEKCGQDPYLCQCSNNMKIMYRNFNPEKDEY